MRYEAVLADAYEFADEGVGLDSGSHSDFYTLLDLYEWANEDLVSDYAAIQIGWLDDGHPFAELDVDDS